MVEGKSAITIKIKFGLASLTHMQNIICQYSQDGFRF